MPGRSDVRVVVHHDAIQRLLTSDDARDMLRDASHPVVAEARARAPKDTGAGARRIHTEMVLDRDEWDALISWDREHFYLYWHEKGSRQLPARPFLVPALRAAVS